MTKGQKRELNFRNAMTRDLYQLRVQGIITQQTYEVSINSLQYIHIRKNQGREASR
ncbi:hypothetical protein ABIB44_000196 [Hymenobacter sp. UYCo722]